MKDLYKDILRLKDEDKVPMILVGNKCDLEEDRQVSWAEGEELASLFGCSMFETSAKDCINIEESFSDLVRETRKNYPARSKFSRKNKGKGACSLF